MQHQVTNNFPGCGEKHTVRSCLSPGLGLPSFVALHLNRALPFPSLPLEEEEGTHKTGSRAPRLLRAWIGPDGPALCASRVAATRPSRLGGCLCLVGNRDYTKKKN